MTVRPYGAIQKLAGHHELQRFDCGAEALNQFLERYALVNQAANSAQTYVLCQGENSVVGYYSLAVGSIEHAAAPARVSRGLARHAIPVMLLARLAVALNHQGRGLGQALLKDALLRTLQAADIAGVRALLVHAKDDRARDWYERFDFTPSPTDSHHMFLLVKDLKALL